MKNIKQYFVNGTNMPDEEVLGDSSNVAGLEQVDLEQSVTKGKRKRVKIRISRTRNSKERMCNIIESKNDLIDKTPSPFNVKTSSSENTPQNETPKSHLISWSTEQSSKKAPKLPAAIDRNQLGKVKNILQTRKRLIAPIIVDDSSSDDAKSANDEDTPDAEIHNDADCQREESNAFQVLMNRSKPIQYKSSMSQSVKEVELTEKISESKAKRTERLIALADKKGYSKRKVAELEEGERIEKNIEDRTRFFKANDKDDITHKKDNNTELSLKNNKQHSGNLLDYFSKSPMKSPSKDTKCMSTFIVKADVHRTNNSDTEPAFKSRPNKTYCDKRCSKSELDLSTVDDIHIIASESLYLPQTTKRDKQKREKPRWSMRIKLQSSENNDCTDDSTDDELFSLRSKAKLNTASKSRSFVDENNGIHTNNPNGYHKKKLRDNECKESIKERDVSSTAKDTVISNGNEDIDACPKKSHKTSKIKQKLNVPSETVITIIDDECEIINKRKPNEKLAPLFLKRRRTDPVAMAARRLFLQSNMTDVENKNTDSKPNNGNAFTLLFPTISHVTQLKDNPNSPTAVIEHKFPSKVEKKYSPVIDVNNYKCITDYSETPKAPETISEPVKENIDQVLAEIEKICPDVQRMWKTVSMIRGKLNGKKSQARDRKSLERKRMLTENIKDDKDQSHDCTWTCKYKPTSAQDIVGNEEAARKLKDWLISWRTSLTKKDDGSSGDEFYSSDCSTSCNNENDQIAVLLGPHGSGKSASVYAVAEELGYSVLEVNASSRRTGKRILKELEEATKSHRIKKDKNRSLFEQVTNRSEETKISQNSLILLDDIDLIFEEDEGFISAAYQLASNTKRPIVMTCRDACPHLSKMAPQQNKIYFQKVNGSRVSTFMELISLAETGYRIPLDYLIKLLQAGDLRQALLQLQYLLMSDPAVLSDQSTTMKPSFWQDMQRYVYKPAIKSSKKQRMKKDTNTKRPNDITHIMNNLADDLDSISLVSSLIDIEDTVLNMSKENVQPNLSLAENVSFYSASRDLSADVASFMSARVLYKAPRVNECVQNKNILRKQLNQGVDLALSHVTVCLDQRIMALDYLPTARTICRAEESRSTTNYKRGNRFFHYLHGLKVPAALIKPNILAAACRMLREKADKSASARTAPLGINI